MTSADLITILTDPKSQKRIKQQFVSNAVAVLADANKTAQYPLCEKILHDQVSNDIMTMVVMGDAGILAANDFDSVTDVQIFNRISGLFSILAKAE